MNIPPQKPPTRESVEAAQRFAASLPDDTCYTVIHEYCGKWRVWAYYKTLRGAEKEAKKITNRPVEIISPKKQSKPQKNKPTDYERGFQQGYNEGYSTGYQVVAATITRLLSKTKASH